MVDWVLWGQREDRLKLTVNTNEKEVSREEEKIGKRW